MKASDVERLASIFAELDPEEVERLRQEVTSDLKLRRGWRMWVPSRTSLAKNIGRLAVTVLLAVGALAGLPFCVVLLVCMSLTMTYLDMLREDLLAEAKTLAGYAVENWTESLVMVASARDLLAAHRQRSTKHPGPLDGANNVVIIDSRYGGHDA